MPVSSIVDPQLDAMFSLFERTYEGVTRTQFAADLAEKDHVILLADGGGALRGFSTLRDLSVTVDGVEHRGVYSGDTVIEDGFRGTGALGRAFLWHLLVRRFRQPRVPLWWFLISKGYKTYLLMANNFPEHWPRHEAPTPPAQRALQIAFARRLFGDAYDEATNIVRSFGPRLRAEVAPIHSGLLSNPRVAYFQAQNPGWERGDELVCVASMPWSLPLSYAWKKLPGAMQGAT